jgi:xanthine dehydrogenase iron-sulfur cluster and FAD-binding subunit A
VLAGGTFLLVQMKMERASTGCLVNVGKLPELSRIVRCDGDLHIGACVSIRSVGAALQVQPDYAALADACAAFGSTQIQVMGTLGGNICSGSPASDTVPALVAFGAQLRLASSRGERVLPVEEFLLGPGETALRPDELLVAIKLPRPERGTGSAFVKLSRVRADLAKASAAAVLLREGDRVAGCRLALGAVGPTVLRARRAEQALVGGTFGEALALEAGRLAATEVSPIDDVRSTAWYRREVVQAMVHDALQLAWERAGTYSGAGAIPSGGSAEARDIAGATGHRPLRVGPDERQAIELTVNGERRRLRVAPNELLLNVLREQLQLTGSKYGCGIGECGACTVLLNGEPALSCLTLALAVDGGEVLTVEGLQGPDGALHRLQEAFVDQAAFQCGYCTPGMLMMTEHLLQERPCPTQDEIRDHLKGNRCRCTGFTSIVRAVMSCAHTKRD